MTYYIGSVNGIYLKAIVDFGETILVTLRGREIEFRNRTVANYIDLGDEDSRLDFRLMEETLNDGEFVEWKAECLPAIDSSKELRLRAILLRLIDEAPPDERPRGTTL